MTHQSQHLDGSGVCQCDCEACTGGNVDDLVCICPDCNTGLCNLHHP